MDTPLAATVHKENVHVGGGKTFTMKKPIKLKPAGKRRKALADFRDTYAPSSGVSNDVELKPMAHGKQQIAGADSFTTKKQILVSLENFEMGSKPLNHGLSDEEIKQRHVWDLDEGIDECYCSTWVIPEDEESYYNLLTASLFYPPLCDDKGYDIEDSDLHSPMSFPGSPYTPEEIFGASSRFVLDEYPLPELEFEDDFGLGNDNRSGGITFENLYIGDMCSHFT